ncbi:TPA: hypothetical protein ACIELX_005143 [Escherichia coli]
MNKRNLNILASLVIMLALTGCNESEIDKITLIGRDKSDLAQNYKAQFQEQTSSIEVFALQDKNAPNEQEPHTHGNLIDGKVESSLTTNVGKYTFMQIGEMMTREYGKPVATKDRIFDQEAISGMDCIETKTCGAGKYYEVYRGKDRLVMVINGAGFVNEKEGVTLLSITDKMIKVSRLKEDKRK